MSIEQPPAIMRWLYPQALWRMDPRQRSVYLTFDDGPLPETTPYILDTLARYGVHATFFMVGENAARYPQLLAAVRQQGHRTGNHTYNHISGCRHYASDYLANTDKAETILRTRRLFRPPHGWMTPPQYHALLRATYTIVMWDLVTRDYSNDLTPADIFGNVRRYTRPGSIVTFHDSLRSIDKLHTVLPQAIRWLQDQGYSFKTFD